MSAVLRLSGNRSLLETVISQSRFPFTESGKCQRERRLDPEGDHSETTYNLTLSDADAGCLPQQIREVDAFLELNGQLIQEAMACARGCTCVIDFAWDFPRDAIGQYNRFPTQLLGKFAELNIDLEISVYGISEQNRNT